MLEFRWCARFTGPIQGWPRVKLGHKSGNPANRPFINGLPDPVWDACYTGAEDRGNASWYGTFRRDLHHAWTMPALMLSLLLVLLWLLLLLLCWCWCWCWVIAVVV